MLFGMMALAVAAGAASAAPPSGAEIANLKSLDVAVAGRISERCQMGSIGSIDFGNLERAGLGATARVPFDCNIPFTFAIKANNGGLAHEGLPEGQGGYAGTVPYSIDIEIPVHRPRPGQISQHFRSEQLVAGREFSSRGGISYDTLVLTMNLASSERRSLLGGEYSETLTITITPD